MYEILLLYKYTFISNPEALLREQRALCEQLDLKGRLIIASEGINVTLEGLRENTAQYMEALVQDERFRDIHFKRSIGTGQAFPKLSIKIRSEIVSAHLGDDDVSPQEITGKYLEAEELHRWINEKKKFYIIDMRNDYEHKVGHFAGSILPALTNFRDLPQILPALEYLKGETIVTVCTGGVRCEKASGFLVKHGFKDVYQLSGGIVTYMEKYPNEDFKGALYVFDGRVTMGFNTDDLKHEIVGRCELCTAPTERYIDCAFIHCSGKRHILCCTSCARIDGKAYCQSACEARNKKISMGSR